MADLTETQASGSTKIVGSDSTGLEQTPVQSTGLGALHSNLRDSSGNEITSAPNVNSNQMLHVQRPDTASAAATLNTLNSVVTVSMTGLSSVGFQLNVGTLIGTIQAQASVDGGTTYVGVPFYDPSNSTVLNSLVFTSANTLKVLSILPIGGASHVQVKVTAFTSGSATGLLRASNVSSAAGAVTAAAFGTVVNTYPPLLANIATLILAANSNRKYAYISNTSGNNISIQFGSTTGLTTSRGLILAAQVFYEFKGSSLYTGNIYGISSVATTLSVTEGTP